MNREVPILREPEIRAHLDMRSCMQAVEEGFSSFATGRAELGAVISLRVPESHVTAVGSDEPDKQDLDTRVLARADILVADNRTQCLQMGEIHHAVKSGAIEEGRITAELGEITAGLKKGRTSDAQITVCDLTGIGVQDVAVRSATSILL